MPFWRRQKPEDDTLTEGPATADAGPSDADVPAEAAGADEDPEISDEELEAEALAASESTAPACVSAAAGSAAVASASEASQPSAGVASSGLWRRQNGIGRSFPATPADRPTQRARGLPRVAG